MHDFKMFIQFLLRCILKREVAFNHVFTFLHIGSLVFGVDLRNFLMHERSMKSKIFSH